jgi:hypothetical protein
MRIPWEIKSIDNAYTYLRDNELLNYAMTSDSLNIITAYGLHVSQNFGF